MSNDKYINEDTYQTLTELKIEPQSNYASAITPLWKAEKDEFKKYDVFVGTPVHSDVSIHYTQALIEFQRACFKKKIGWGLAFEVLDNMFEKIRFRSGI